MEQPTVRHRIYADGQLILELLDAEWYDTATPYVGCLRDLRTLYARVVTTPLLIESDGNRYHVRNQQALLQWVAVVFERGRPLGFTRIGLE